MGRSRERRTVAIISQSDLLALISPAQLVVRKPGHVGSINLRAQLQCGSIEKGLGEEFRDMVSQLGVDFTLDESPAEDEEGGGEEPHGDDCVLEVKVEDLGHMAWCILVCLDKSKDLDSGPVLTERPALSHTTDKGQRLLDTDRSIRSAHDVYEVDVAVPDLLDLPRVDGGGGPDLLLEDRDGGNIVLDCIEGQGHESLHEGRGGGGGWTVR